MKQSIKNGLTNIRKRIEFWLLFLILGILVDEYIKEGYFFKIEDIFNLMFTHEKIIVILSIILATTIVYRRVRNNKKTKLTVT